MSSKEKEWKEALTDAVTHPGIADVIAAPWHPNLKKIVVLLLICNVFI